MAKRLQRLEHPDRGEEAVREGREPDGEDRHEYIDVRSPAREKLRQDGNGELADDDRGAHVEHDGAEARGREALQSRVDPQRNRSGAESEKDEK